MKKFVAATITALTLHVAFGVSFAAADPAVRSSNNNWTGCYLGGNAGVAVLHENVDILNVGASAQSASAVGGIQGGCDYQTGNWVFGIQDMFDWTGLDKTKTLPPIIAGPTETFTTKIPWLDLLTLRGGYLFDPQTLVYLKGGAAWSRARYDDINDTGGPLQFFHSDSTRTGWTLGIGFERYFAPNWSWFVEYDFIDLGRQAENLTSSIGTLHFSVREEVHTVLLGINYRFGR
jgi:outer membrane immunogenic protein